jgi:flagellar hook protein FlgE
VALNVAETQAQASAQVLETADEVLGTLIDVKV